MIKIIWSKAELTKLESQLNKEEISYMIINHPGDLPNNMIGIEIEASQHDDLKKVIQMIEYEKMQMLFPTTDGFVQLYLADIYYLESFGEEIVVHLKQMKEETIKKPLYQLEELLNPYHFVRISKSFIVNMRRISHIKVGLNARLHLTLTDNSQLQVTRSFTKAFKKRLNI